MMRARLTGASLIGGDEGPTAGTPPSLAGLAPATASPGAVASGGQGQARPARAPRMDRLSSLAVRAAAAALARAGADEDSFVRERLGIVVGTCFGCHATNEAYYRGYLAEGARGASPRLFAYTLPSSPLGEVSIGLGARGPGETLTSGRHAGLEAVLAAARLCESGDADAVLAIIVEVGGGTLPSMGYSVADGAAAFLVERAAVRRGGVLAPPGFVFSGASAFEAEAPVRALAAARARALAASALGDPGATGPLVESEAGEGDGALAAAYPLAAFLLANRARAPSARFFFAATDESGGATALILRADEGVERH